MNNIKQRYEVRSVFKTTSNVSVGAYDTQTNRYIKAEEIEGIELFIINGNKKIYYSPREFAHHKCRLLNLKHEDDLLYLREVKNYAGIKYYASIKSNQITLFQI